MTYKTPLFTFVSLGCAGRVIVISVKLESPRDDFIFKTNLLRSLPP